MDTKTIFVLGNGFDLAHYLPTAYVHFMDAMMVVESSGEDAELGFDDLYDKYIAGKCSDRDKKFFQKTKELYKIDNLKLSIDIVKDLKDKLKDNGWFQHFKHHLTDVDTWIDFENEIENVLISFDLIFSLNFSESTISDNLNNMGMFAEPEVNIKDILRDEKIFDWSLFNKTGLKIHSFINLLKNFGILKHVYGYIIYDKVNKPGRHHVYTRQESKRLEFKDYEDFENYVERKIDEHTTQTSIKKSFDNIVETRYLSRNSTVYTSFKENEIFKKILKDLEGFSEIFTRYIDLVINRLEPVIPFYDFADVSHNIESVYTFNYSNTFERLYPNSSNNEYDRVQYIHGNAEQENIVLGICDLENGNLKKYKIYGFVKTFQKLIKNTDYIFLHNNIVNLSKKKNYNYLSEKNYKVIIWGHSLDASDAEYIKEIFTLNDEAMLNKVTIEVWYHGSPHVQLANLIHIMGKDIVQDWMKKDWLSFNTQAPNVYKLNQGT